MSSLKELLKEHTSIVFTQRAIESLTMDTSEGSYVFTQRAIESLTMDTSEGSYVFTQRAHGY